MMILLKAEIVVGLVMWFGLTLMYFSTSHSASNFADADNYLAAIYKSVSFIALAAYVIALNKIFRK